MAAPALASACLLLLLLLAQATCEDTSTSSSLVAETKSGNGVPERTQDAEFYGELLTDEKFQRRARENDEDGQPCGGDGGPGSVMSRMLQRALEWLMRVMGVGFGGRGGSGGGGEGGGAEPATLPPRPEDAEELDTAGSNAAADWE
ncbi:uncharacterized protein LOC124556539 [Schistocerca americana]|uniref:uncharacterized protein LOC124556539 n=1 Tax=Schistocerca americana TaxID=7009 RepID=UPI001F4F71C2|nr:uncharacterized protein LOC124556539 [Schistocerca americana]